MENTFSHIQHTFPQFEANAELAAMLSQVQPFTDAERTPQAREKRLREAFASHEAFDKYYFPPSMYESYAPPCELHGYIGEVAQVAGVHTIFGPRKHGKTAKGKTTLLWMLLCGKIKIAGTYAETILKSANILRDCIMLLADNERIREDFKIEFAEANSDQCRFRATADFSFMNDGKKKKKSASTKISALNEWKYIASFSEGRSLRGYTRLFGRPQFLLGDDIETLESSFSNDAVQLRIDKISEAFQSLSDGGTFLILGNDFTTAGALHRLSLEQEQGILARSWTVTSFKAWIDRETFTTLSKVVSFSKDSVSRLEQYDGFSLWFKKYSAMSENELKEMLKPKSGSDWQANFQQNPIPPEGDFFTRDHYHEYTSIPNDARGVLWVDPNLSKKSKGDTTAMPVYKYSVSTDSYFITEALCRSFADSNKLLDEVFRMRKAHDVKNIGFDGNVNQESNWTNNVRNWCLIKKLPFPHIEYKRYNVDELAKNFQSAYAADKVFFPAGFAKTPEGEKFLAQFFSFTGVKLNKKDDAPDSIICAHEFIHDRKITGRKSTPPVPVNDVYTN